MWCDDSKLSKYKLVVQALQTDLWWSEILYITAISQAAWQWKGIPLLDISLNKHTVMRKTILVSYVERNIKKDLKDKNTFPWGIPHYHWSNMAYNTFEHISSLFGARQITS
jgi:hypothetical protein